MHPAALSDEDLLAQCDISFTRRGGPGGQHRNKVETAVVLLHKATGVTAEAHERRSQADNKREAIHRLRLRLAVDVRGTETDVLPSALWQERVRGERIAISGEHADLPILIAEALDVLNAHQFVTNHAAETLGITTSQLVKLLKLYPPALAQLNEARRRSGKRPLN